jgi:hypothetical protein
MTAVKSEQGAAVVCDIQRVQLSSGRIKLPPCLCSKGGGRRRVTHCMQGPLKSKSHSRRSAREKQKMKGAALFPRGSGYAIFVTRKQKVRIPFALWTSALIERDAFPLVFSLSLVPCYGVNLDCNRITRLLFSFCP